MNLKSIRIYQKCFMNISKIANSCYFRYLSASIVAVVFSSVFLLLGRNVVGEFVGLNENFYLKYYYNILNHEFFLGRSYNVPDSIVIVNIQKYRNRKDFARILEKVYNLNPRVIGVDIFFRRNPDVIDTVNDRLIRTIKKVGDKTIFPCNYSTNADGVIYTEYPFFKNIEGVDNIIYASPLAHEFYGYYKFDDSSIINKSSDSPVLPTMSMAIAQQSKMSVVNTSVDFYVNYTKKDFSQIIIDDTMDLRLSRIQDKIVLIGDMSEIKDMTVLPFRFGNKRDISGIENIAYSLINLIQYDRASLDCPMRFIGFKDWPQVYSIILSFILVLISCIIINWYNDKKEKMLINNKLRASFFVLLYPGVFIIVEFIIVVLNYAITYMTNTIPDLFLCMVSLAVIGVSNEFINIIFHNK